MDLLDAFESGVNPEGIQTHNLAALILLWFESGVNPEGIQTFNIPDGSGTCLRVV